LFVTVIFQVFVSGGLDEHGNFPDGYNDHHIEGNYSLLTEMHNSFHTYHKDNNSLTPDYEHFIYMIPGEVWSEVAAWKIGWNEIGENNYVGYNNPYIVDCIEDIGEDWLYYWMDCPGSMCCEWGCPQKPTQIDVSCT
jgi:hypothetical protein